MFKKIFVPVDLAHTDKLEKALHVAGKLAQDCGASLVYGGVTTTTSTAVASTPEEFTEKLSTFATSQANHYSAPAEAYSVTSHDPATELTSALLDAIDDCGADAVVMASHVPGVLDHLFSSNAGEIAAKAAVSVFVIR